MTRAFYRYLAAAVPAMTMLLGPGQQTVPGAWPYSAVNERTVEARLAQFAGDNRRREHTLKKLFSEAGCEGDRLFEQEVKSARQPNVVCLLPGDTGRMVIVGAHFDRVSEGDGVVDNWSGASLLPSLYESLKSDPRHHSYIFVGFTDEEAGLVGSYFYVHQMSDQAVALTDAMVNLDTLGLGPARVWASHSDRDLVGKLFYIAKLLEIPVSNVDVDDIGSTDSEEFATKNIPRITLHSLTRETWEGHILHSSKDTMASIRFADYYQTYRLVAAYLAFLDQLPARAPDPR